MTGEDSGSQQQGATGIGPSVGRFLLLFAGLFAFLTLSHWTLLRLPYYWDEAGYYIPAAWDFFRTGSLIPSSTLSNAHPPLPSLYLALWWNIFGFCPLVTRLAALSAAALGLTALGLLAQRLTGSRAIAAWTVLLTAIYPVWFAQSSLAHADIFAASCTLCGLVCALTIHNASSGGKQTEEETCRLSKKCQGTTSAVPQAAQNKQFVFSPWRATAWFAAAALAKETSIVVPLSLAAICLYEAMRSKAPVARSRKLIEAAWLCSCVLPLACWYAWHKHKTGFLFGNPEFLRYNAQANLEPLRMAAALGHRVLHLTAHMNLFVLVGLALASLLLPRRSDQAPRTIAVPTQITLLVLLAANALFFSVLGGALLTRYLLPIFPLVILLSLSVLHNRLRRWQLVAVLAAAAFLAGLVVNPPYGFAPEDNLAYAHLIRLHQAGIHELNVRYPGATVLSAWPLTDELTKPELGYVQQPYEVFSLDDFSAAQIDRAAQEPGGYSVALVFSTK